jgi:AsmA family protein
MAPMIPSVPQSVRSAARRTGRVARKTAIWTLVGVGALILLLVLALLYVAFVGVTVSAAPWRDAIAKAASDNLRRPVVLEGPLLMTVSLRPALRIGGVRIDNPPGFATPAFATLGDARAEVDLKPWLQGRLRIENLEASNVKVSLERLRDGSANWVFDLSGNQTVPAEKADSGKPFQAPDVSLEVRRLALRNIDVEYRNAFSTQVRSFALDTLDGSIERGKPIQVTLKGQVDKSFPYQATVQAGPLDQLIRSPEPWPFSVAFEFLGTRLNINGSRDPKDGTTELLFGLGTDNLREFERFLQSPLPKVGTTAVVGKAREKGGVYTVTGLHVSYGTSLLSGDIEVALVGERPRVTGALSADSIDLRPFLEFDQPSDEPEKPISFADLEKQTLDLRALVGIDADFELKVGRWIGLPGNIRDSMLAVRIAGGRLAAPVAATIADVPLKGEIDLDGAAEVPAFAITLGTKNSPLRGGLAELLAGVRGVQGYMGRFDLGLAGRGPTLGELVRGLEAKVYIENGRLSYGNVEGGRPVEFTLERFDIRLPHKQGMTGDIRGTLIGERFAARLKGGDLPSILRELRSPVEIELEGSGAKLTAKGVLARPGTESGTDIAFRFEAPRAGDLSRWIGAAPDSKLPVSIAGKAQMQSDEWHLEGLKLKLGRSDISIDAHRTGIGSAKPMIVAAVRSALLDTVELARFTPPPKPAADKPKATKTSIDIPILPGGIDLAEADIGIGLARVILERGELTDVGFAMRLRDGRMESSPFGATLVGTPFTGSIALDLRGDMPEASLSMAAGKVDVGDLLKRLKVAEDIEVKVDSLDVALVGRGSRLMDMLERSQFEAKLKGGQYILRDPTKNVLATIGLKDVVAAAPPGKPIALTVDGALDDVPVAIKLTSGALPDFVRNTSFVPFKLEAETSGTRLDLVGKVALPIRQGAAELDIRLAGDKLNSLNKLARADLPPWGPWSIAGPFRLTPTAYDVPNLEMRVGSSSLNGQGRFDLGGKRPRLDIRVSAPRIQLDDFKLAGWSAVDKPKQKEEEKSASVDEMRAQAKQAAADTQKLLSPETLRRLDALIDVEVQQVLSGADKLGSGKLRAALTDGRLAFDPIEVEVPGGSARLSFAYEPSARDVLVETSMRVVRFDYGVLARRIKPDTDIGGLFSLNLDMTSRAPTLDAVMAHADGRIDLAVWPIKMKSGIFDLWAVNVFVALLPAVDPGSESLVNCAIARFDLKGGKLKQDAILIDTSRMRVAGAGNVDFDTEKLAFKMQPRAKKSQFFSLATPVGVTGTLTDFKVAVAAEDIFGTFVRFFGSVITVPLESLRGGAPPRDGADICTDPMRVVISKK